MDFAQSELNKYLCKITDADICEIEVTVLAARENDGYEIAVCGGKGAIRGYGQRSALLGVYAFLRALGCRFLAPGEKNEYIVRLAPDKINCTHSFSYDIRHRGIVIEGDADENTVERVADWAVKNGMNSYFIQFEEGKEFFERGLKQAWNPYREKADYTDETITALYGKAAEAVKKRGMYFHAMGHGWTCHALGLDGAGWYKRDEDTLREEDRKKLAQIGGERKFFGGIPLNTNLCYSDPAARQSFVQSVIDYACAHPTVDYLHIWLADNRNNFCECDECAKKLPSEQYIELLNEIDARLTDLHSEMKLVFLIYYELLIPPQKAELVNPDRFVLMFAPITRSYDFGIENYFADADKAVLPPYKRNDFVMPDTAQSIAYLRKWQEIFHGDSFIFDYPLMWECFAELAGIKLAKTIADDIDGIRALRLNGYLSCQVQKTFFPTGLGIYAMVRKLEDANLSFREIALDYFTTAFGSFADNVYKFLEEFSDTQVVQALKRAVPYEDPCVQTEAMRLKVRACEGGREIAAMQQNCADPFVVRNLEKVRCFAAVYVTLMDLLLLRGKQNSEDERARVFEQLSKQIYAHEKEFADEWDCMYYCCNFHALVLHS